MTHVKARPSVFGTGLIALDLVMSIDKSQPVRAWTGGTCGNVLSILGYLGWDSYPIARLNGDVASLQVKEDFSRWGVHLDFAECTPTSATPIILQEIRHDKHGNPIHRFAWSCPHCGKWFPGYKPVTVRNISVVAQKLVDPKVFFMDRLSRAGLTLAAVAAEKGALVVFEPSAKMDSRLLEEVLQIAHIIKYSDQRVQRIEGIENKECTVLLEVQTSGEKGLRYRSRLFNANITKWQEMPALPLPVIADTCGAGDWCTAGLLSIVGREGYEGFKSLSRATLKDALRYGQALAAWTCRFEGARGGMYCCDKDTFDEQIKLILKGDMSRLIQTTCQQNDTAGKAQISCPSCAVV